MDTEILKTFILLAQTQHFTKAAKLLHRSQATISMQISRLEEMLGVPLFHRNSRNVKTTSEGEKLIGYAKKILDIQEQMISEFSRPKARGLIRFGTPEDIASSYLPSILSSFSEHYPDVQLDVSCEFTERLIKGFENQEYDLVLVKQDPNSPHAGSEEIWSEPLVWVASRQSRYSKSSLTQIPLVLSPAPCVYRKKALETLNRDNVDWRISFSSASLTCNLAAVRAGLGVTVLPKDLVPEGLEILIDMPELESAQIAILKSTRNSEAAKTMADYVTAHISSHHKLRELQQKAVLAKKIKKSHEPYRHLF